MLQDIARCGLIRLYAAGCSLTQPFIRISAAGCSLTRPFIRISAAGCSLTRPYTDQCGSFTVNTVRSMLLSAVIVPPCAVTISLAMARPSPAPPLSVERAESSL